MACFPVLVCRGQILATNSSRNVYQRQASEIMMEKGGANASMTFEDWVLRVMDNDMRSGKSISMKKKIFHRQGCCFSSSGVEGGGALPALGGASSRCPLRNRPSRARRDKLELNRDAETGAVFMNEYLVIQNLGQGSFGKVRLVMDLRTNRRGPGPALRPALPCLQPCTVPM